MQTSNLNEFNFINNPNLLTKNNFFSNLIANDYTITMENKENYSLNDSINFKMNDTTLSRSSSSCSLLNLNSLSNSTTSNSATSSLTTSPTSTTFSPFKMTTTQQQQQQPTQMLNNQILSRPFYTQQMQIQTKLDDIDWNVLQNAEKYLQRDDTAWINKLNKEFWWNINKLTDMLIIDTVNKAQIMNTNRVPRKICSNNNRNQYQTQQYMMNVNLPQQQQQQHQQSSKYMNNTNHYANKQNFYNNNNNNNNSRIFGRIITNSYGFPQQV